MKTKSQTSRPRGVSLPRDLELAGIKRAKQLDISFSKLIQRLLRKELGEA